MANILLVDDDPRVHDRLSRWLASDGHKVLSASDGEAGRREALSEQPDLVITDMQMPYMDGLTLVNRLRAAGFLSPIIAFFAGVTTDREEAFLEAGANVVISKAETPEVLLTAVVRLLKKED